MQLKKSVALKAEAISLVHAAYEFKQLLLAEIAQAKSRIYISALYIQDDEAGREILAALYQAKQANPELDICLFVDFHRAQRGLIGEKQHGGNRDLYLALEQQTPGAIKIYGVPVKRKELLGVLHLKGMVIDDVLLFSGASLNDVYLQQQQRYRLDRYYRLASAPLANSFCEYLSRCFIRSGLAPELNQAQLPDKKQLKRNIGRLTRLLKSADFVEASCDDEQEINATMLVGCGRRGNKLNKTIRELVRSSQQSLVLFTPYFNLPKPLLRDVDAALKRGVQVSLTVGDKTANDFYNADPETFSTVEIVPYIYERLLFAFLKRREKYLASGQLQVRLWKDGCNSFHLKGVVVDQQYHLLTGSNLNPRAWALDLENAVLLEDKQQKLMPAFNQELAFINQHTQLITTAGQIETIANYPEKPRKLMKKLRMTQIDRILKRFL